MIDLENSLVKVVTLILVLVISLEVGAGDYNYDPLNRLTSATIDGSYVEYVYDKAGNLLETKTPYTISTSVLGAGVVTDNLDKINCGDDCQGVYNNNTSVTLTATPDAGNSFTGWSGACSGTGACSINVTAQHTVQATFSGAVNNAPAFAAFGPFAVDENSPNGSFVGDVDANDGDGGSTDSGISYSLSGGTGQGVFSINSTGVISVANSSQLDYETVTSFIVTVRADDGVHQTYQNVTINLNDLAEGGNPPIVVDNGPFSVDENSPNGTFVGDVNANDGDGGANDAGITYIFGGPGTCSGAQTSNCDIVEIDANTGVISVKNSVLLDYESITSVTNGLIITDNNSQTNSSVTININDLTETQLPAPPVFVTPANGTIENNTTVTITGTGIIGASLTVLTDNSQTLCVVASIAANGQWSCTANLSDGNYTIFAQQTVGLNTSTAASTNFKVFTSTNIAAPVITAPSDGTVLNSTTFNLTGTRQTGYGIGLTISVDTTAGTFVGEFCQGSILGAFWTCQITLPVGSYDISVYHHETLSGNNDVISPADVIGLSISNILFNDGFE